MIVSRCPPIHTTTRLSGVTAFSVSPFPSLPVSCPASGDAGSWFHQSNVEIKIDRVYTVSRASLFLPFSVEDAARSEAEVEASQVRVNIGHAT